MWRMLGAIGVPDAVLHAFCLFYQDNAQRVKLQGCEYSSFRATAGVRQGCPLSPLLFVICVDILLRRLTRLFPECMIPAFADDIALVMPCLFKDATGVMHTFRQFGRISGLNLNLPTTIIVPLWPFQGQCFRRTLRSDLPEWSKATVSDCARYLGFLVGPGRADAGWSSAVKKFEDRASQWSGLKLGLLWTTFAYNMFAISVLGFLGQLDCPPKYALEAETRALRLCAPGPGNWCLPSDLWRLQENFGMPKSFASLAHTSFASKLRISVLESLCLAQRVGTLKQLLVSTVFFDRLGQWRDWYQSCFCLQISAAVGEAACPAISPGKIFSDLLRASSPPGKPPEVAR